MNRAERRRFEKAEAKKKTVVYNLTQEQLDNAVKEGVEKELQLSMKQITEDAVHTALVLFLTLPMGVLRDYYWKKSYAKRLPKFTERVLDYYKKYEAGELDMEKLKEELWEYGGIKFEERNNL